MSPLPRRHGATLPELLLAVSLMAALAGGVLRAVADLARAQRSMAVRAEALHLTRLARTVLGAELQGARRGPDWDLTSDESLVLRGFRGTGTVCWHTVDSDGTWRVRVLYDGMRQPNPVKDSALVVFDDGSAGILDLTDSRSAGCPSLPGLELTVAGPPADRPSGPEPAPILIRVFEQLEYHLADSTLRLRRGRAGRQPVGPSILDPAAHFRALGSLGIEVHLQFGRSPGVAAAPRSRVLVVPSAGGSGP